MNSEIACGEEISVAAPDKMLRKIKAFGLVNVGLVSFVHVAFFVFSFRVSFLLLFCGMVISVSCLGCHLVFLSLGRGLAE